MQTINEIKNYKSNRFRRWIILFVVLLLAAGGTLWYRYKYAAPEKIRYVTHSLAKGNLELTVSATGYLQPRQSVAIGSEVSGTVDAVYVDYNDAVTVGQVLARINATKIESSLKKAEATLSAAEATMKSAEAQLYAAQATVERDKKLRASSKGVLPSQSDWDTHWSAYLSAKAAIASAKAQMEQASQGVVSARYDLDRTAIYSPVEGIVLTRQIDPGQTVAASFQTPTLFTIAQDLTQMELQVSVDEADIAKVAVGQHAVFAVDAYPQTQFEATIKKVSVNSEITDGVVTYITVMDVNNSDLRLRPGMSADATITTRVIEDAFIVPRAALLYTPVKTQEHALFAFHEEEEAIVDDTPHVWVESAGTIKRVNVRLLGSSGANSAIRSDALHENDRIVLAREQKP